MKRLPMRKIREALRLRADGFSGRQVAQSLSLGRATTKPSPDLAVALALPGRCLQVGFDRHQQRLVRDENGGDKLVHGSGGISQLRAE